MDTKTPLFAEFLNPQITAMFQYMTLYCKLPMNLLFGNLWLFGGVLKKVMPSLSPADMTKPQFSYTFDCIKKVFPQYPPVPMILPAGTDARHFTDICPCVLRFAPIRLSAQQLASVHGENENIDLDAIRDAVKFYKVFLESYM